MLDPETAAAYAYCKRHDDANIYVIDDAGHAKPAPPIDLERALTLVRLAQGNTHPVSYNPPKGRWK